jgi:hypothetical protein
MRNKAATKKVKYNIHELKPALQEVYSYCIKQYEQKVRLLNQVPLAAELNKLSIQAFRSKL